MTALEKQLRQLCQYQDDVAVGLENHDEYMMRRAMRLRENQLKKILSEYGPEQPSALLVSGQAARGMD